MPDSSSEGLRPFETNDRFYASVEAEYPGAELFVSQTLIGCTILCLQNGHCRLIYNNENVPDQIFEVFELAAKAGYCSIGDEILVDFRYFSGVIDWGYAKKRRVMAPYMKIQPRKSAYVMRDQVAELTAKAMVLWLTDYDCQIFHNLTDAETWLGWI